MPCGMVSDFGKCVVKAVGVIVQSFVRKTSHCNNCFLKSSILSFNFIKSGLHYCDT